MFLCNAFARYNEDADCVETGQIKISEKKLYTSFVYSCSVLTFSYKIENKTYNFLAHVDAFGENMQARLTNKLSRIPLNNISSFNVYYGPLCLKKTCANHCECESQKIVKEALKSNNVPDSKINENYLEKWQSEVSIPEENSNELNNVDRILPDDVEGAFETTDFIQY